MKERETTQKKRKVEEKASTQKANSTEQKVANKAITKEDNVSVKPAVAPAVASRASAASSNDGYARFQPIPVGTLDAFGAGVKKHFKFT